MENRGVDPYNTVCTVLPRRKCPPSVIYCRYKSQGSVAKDAHSVLLAGQLQNHISEHTEILIQIKKKKMTVEEFFIET